MFIWYIVPYNVVTKNSNVFCILVRVVFLDRTLSSIPKSNSNKYFKRFHDNLTIT